MSKSNRVAKVLEVVETVQVVQAPVPMDDKGRKTHIDMSMEEIGTKGIKNKSQAIRYLIGENYSPSCVAKYLGIRYQHVNNVSKQTLKRPVVQVQAPAPEVAE